MLCDLWKNRFSWPEELSGRHITVNEVRTYVSTLRKVSYVQIISNPPPSPQNRN